MVFYFIFQFKNKKIYNYYSNKQYLLTFANNKKNIIKLVEKFIAVDYKSKIFKKANRLSFCIISLTIQSKFLIILNNKFFLDVN